MFTCTPFYPLVLDLLQFLVRAPHKWIRGYLTPYFEHYPHLEDSLWLWSCKQFTRGENLFVTLENKLPASLYPWWGYQHEVLYCWNILLVWYMKIVWIPVRVDQNGIFRSYIFPIGTPFEIYWYDTKRNPQAYHHKIILWVLHKCLYLIS